MLKIEKIIKNIKKKPIKKVEKNKNKTILEFVLILQVWLRNLQFYFLNV